MKFTTTIECEFPDTIEICGKKANIGFGLGTDDISYAILSDEGDDVEVRVTKDFRTLCIVTSKGRTYACAYAERKHPTDVAEFFFNNKVGNFLSLHYDDFVRNGKFTYSFKEVDASTLY